MSDQVKADGVGGGAVESQDEKLSKDGEERISPRRLTKSPTRLARKGGVSFPSLPECL